jgi:uncharacterized membrane protein YphA (DoxX/SURF4 family)
MQTVASERWLMLQNRHRNHQLVMFPQLAQFTDVALLLSRVMIGLVFITSGWNHLKDPEARSKDIAMSKGLTIFLCACEVAGSLGVIFCVRTLLAVLGFWDDPPSAIPHSQTLQN